MKKKNKSGRSSLVILRWIWQTIGKDRALFFAALFINVLQGIEGTIFALQLKYTINAGVAGDIDETIKQVIILGIIVLAAIVLYAVGYYINQVGYAKYEQNLRLHTFEKIITREYACITGEHSGEWMTRICSDSFTVYQFVLTILPDLVKQLISIVGASIALCTMFPKGVVLLILGGGAVIGSTTILRGKLKGYQQDFMRADSSLRSYMQEHLTNMIVIRSFNQEPVVANKAKEISQDAYKVRIDRTKFLCACFSILYAAVRGGYYIGVVLCGYMITKGRITFGDMTSITTLVNQLVTPFVSISKYIPEYYSALASAERLMDIESYPSDHDEKIYDDSYIRGFYEDKFASIGLKNAKFSYTHDDSEYESTVIENLNVDIQKGDYVAITGKSGCGKSTVMKLLMCLYHLEDGQVYLKEKDGSEIDMDPMYRNLFAYVPQGNYLESGTIRDVLCFNNKDIMKDDDRIWRALKIACADSFVSELSDGLDTVLKERGAGLSEGQMQRIAIARAILSNRPILMLDECTSSLDETTEGKVLDNLKSMTDCTVLLITHRMSILKICNKQIEF